MRYRNRKIFRVILSIFALLSLSGCGGSGGSGDDPTRFPLPCETNQTCEENKPPLADAGHDQNITVGETVMLDSKGSFDPDGTITAYRWEANGRVLSTHADFNTSDFTVGTHTVTLIVTDDHNATATDTVTITVNPPQNCPPVAEAGVDKTVETNGSITITGRGSDPDGTIQKYKWKEGSKVLSTRASFVYTAPNTAGVHTLTLTVTDNRGATDSDEMNVTVINRPPVARIRVEESNVTEGDRVVFGGSASSDPDGTITAYRWEANGRVLSTHADFNTSDFTVGTHTVTLIVTDDHNATATDTVTITVRRVDRGCWQRIGDPALDRNRSAGAEVPSMVVGEEGVLYTAWTESGDSGTNYYVDRYDRSESSVAWQALGSALNTQKGSSISNVRIRLDPDDGYPYVYYYEENASSHGHIVKKWDGSSWGDPIYSDTLPGAEDYNLDINGSGNPVIVYKSSDTAFAFKVYVPCGCTAAWQEAYAALDQGATVSDPTLVHYRGTPYIIYYYTDSSGIHSAVRRYDGTRWVSLGSLESDPSTREALCAVPLLNSDGFLYVAYVERGNAAHTSIPPKVNLKYYNGTSWYLVGENIDGTQTVDPYRELESGGGDNRCLAFAKKDDSTLYLAWSHTDRAKTKVYIKRYHLSGGWTQATDPLEENRSVRGASMVYENGKLHLSVMYDSTPGVPDRDDLNAYRCNVQ